VPVGGAGGRIVGQVVNAGGSQVGQRVEIGFFAQQDIDFTPQGEFNVGPIMAGDAGNLILLRQTNVRLTWAGYPSNTSIVRFFMDGPNGLKQVATDNNMQDGVDVQWLVPANLRGRDLFGYAYDSNDNTIGRSWSYSVYSGPPPGQGCMITVNEVTNFYEEPYDDTQTPVGNLTAGTTIETLGRNLGGWRAINPDGISLTSLDELKWLNVNADVTEGVNCN
jgi:hypothetical protein